MGVIDYGAARELLVVARGHPYARDALAAVFDALPGWRWSLVEQPAAEWVLRSEGCATRYAAVVCYDMPGHDFAAPDPPRAVDPSPEYRAALLGLMAAGTGFVFLHHAIAAWPGWEEYARIVGGRFHYRPARLAGREWPDSGYRHGVTHTISVLAEHPVTEGLPARFTMTDELYLCPVFEDAVVPLLASDYGFVPEHFYSARLAVRGTLHSREGWTHPAGSPLVGWAKHHRASPIVYLQGGDDAQALADANYRRLVHNAVEWVASLAAREWARARGGEEST